MAAQAELTGTGAIMGTVDYMAPEQGVSTKDADARADIYSLGCTLHYLLTGKPVFDGESVAAKLLAHHHQPIPDLRNLREGVPDRVQAVFAKLLAKKVEDRYQAMTEVIAELQTCGVGHDPSLTQQTIAPSIENHDFTFLRESPAVATPHRPTKARPARGGKKTLIYTVAGVGLLGVVIAASVLFKMRSVEGPRVAKVESPKATAPVNAATRTAQPTRPWNAPAFQAWMKQVAALPAEKQIEAVSKKLIELNPGFDGKLVGEFSNSKPKIENGVVTELKFQPEHVTDITPLRALPGLKVFISMGGLGRSGKLADLSPLEGMKLKKLELQNTQVSNLSPLRGMPLEKLGCSETLVSDLSPLAGMKLTSLVCRGTQVSDLSPLRGMPLVNLECGRAKVFDLSPLEACKSLRSLDITKTKLIPASVAALQKALPNCKIEWDGAAQGSGVGIQESGDATKPWNKPAFQQWMKDVAALPAAQQIEAVSKKLMELNPGFDGKLTRGDVSGKSPPKIEKGVVTDIGFLTDNVTDISPVLALAELKNLVCRGSGYGKGELSDLSPLRGMPLTKLNCNGTKVFDLLPLKQMKLIYLNCGGTQITDLLPLQKMRLSVLDCKGTQISDLSPLQDCKGLEVLIVNSTKVTAASVAALQIALPNCKIEWDGATQGSGAGIQDSGEGAKQKTPGPAAAGTK